MNTPMRTVKILGFAGAMLASALVGGTLISVVFATPRGSTATSSTTLADDALSGAYCQTFLDTFAAKLGVDESALLPAAKAAADAAIDKAVADGKLSQDTATALKQRVANANGDLCGLLGTRLHGVRGAGAAGIRSDTISAAANALHLSVADLKSKIAGGSSLKQVAADQKVDYATVSAAVHAAAKADLDKLVSAGKLTADREQAILDRLDKALQDGTLGNGGFKGGFKHPWLRPFAPRSPTASPSGATS
jgi:uncharacterized protein YidB (DUF937 family)